MDTKYGRLFTEADVGRIVAQRELEWNSGTLSETLADAIVALEQATGLLTFPADEPLFLLRGQDKTAPDAIAMNPQTGESSCYRESASGWAVTNEFLVRIEAAAAEMREWQETHPDRVKVPD